MAIHTELAAVLKVREHALLRKRAENDVIDREAGIVGDRMVSLSVDLRTGQEALTFVEGVANVRRGKMKERIESVVTEALRTIYGPDYRVEMTYRMKNNRSCLDIEIVKTTTDGEVRRTMGGFGQGLGHGVADTVSVPMRLLVLIGSKQVDRVCILDESYKQLNPERVPLAAQFLKAVADRLGVQIILCSHSESMRDYADAAYHVTCSDGRSQVDKVV